MELKDTIKTVKIGFKESFNDWKESDGGKHFLEVERMLLFLSWFYYFGLMTAVTIFGGDLKTVVGISNFVVSVFLLAIVLMRIIDVMAYKKVVYKERYIKPYIKTLPSYKFDILQIKTIGDNTKQIIYKKENEYLIFEGKIEDKRDSLDSDAVLVTKYIEDYLSDCYPKGFSFIEIRNK